MLVGTFGVSVGVLVGVRVGVCVGVFVTVGVIDGVSVIVGLTQRPIEPLHSALLMKTPGVLHTNGVVTGPQAGIESFWQHCFGVGVTVGVFVIVAVLVTVAVLVAVAVKLAVGDGVGVSVGVPVWVRVKLGVAVGNCPATSQPPSHTSWALYSVFGQLASRHSCAQAAELETLSRQNPAPHPLHAQHIAALREAKEANSTSASA